MAGVALDEVKFPVVRDKLNSQGEFADDRACLVTSVRQPGLSLFLKRGNRLPDFERLQQASLCEERKERRRGPAGICEVSSKPGEDDRVTGFLKHSYLNLGKACTNAFGESTIDGYAGHAVCWVSEPLEIGFRFTLSWKDAG